MASPLGFDGMAVGTYYLRLQVVDGIYAGTYVWGGGHTTVPGPLPNPTQGTPINISASSVTGIDVILLTDIVWTDGFE